MRFTEHEVNNKAMQEKRRVVLMIVGLCFAEPTIVPSRATITSA
jgi:hypothetical protein